MWGSLNGIIYNTERDTEEVVSVLLFYLCSIESTEKFLVVHLPQNSTPKTGYHHMLKCLLVQESGKAHIQSTIFVLFSQHSATWSRNFPSLSKTHK